MKRCNLITNGHLTKNVFLSDMCYESFMQRASLLELYQKEKPSFFQRIYFSKSNQYQPVKTGIIQHFDYDAIKMSDEESDLEANQDYDTL